MLMTLKRLRRLECTHHPSPSPQIPLTTPHERPHPHLLFSSERLQTSDLGTRQVPLGASLPQHAPNIRRPVPPIPRCLLVTTIVVRPAPNQDRIQPHPLLRRIKPLVFKLILANGTHIVDPPRRVRNGYILWLQSLSVGLRRRVGAVARARSVRVVCIDGLAEGNPVGRVNVPAAVSAALEGFDAALVGLEVPVHVCHLLLFAFGVGGEAAAALGTWHTESFV